MQVMVLDDEPNIVKGLSFMIGKFHIPNCEVLPMTDAEEALKVLAGTQIDLALVDINMPGMSGLEFIARAREKAPCRFVILSGYSDFSYAQEAVHLHVKEYLVKPVDEEALKKILSGVFKELYHLTPTQYMEYASSAVCPNFEEIDADDPRYSKHLKDILSFISKNYAGDVSIQRLSDVTGLHPNYISALFVKEMNMGLHKYIENLKLKKAMQILMDNKNTTIAEIASALGYYNERQFFRMFKQNTGKTPGQFRNGTKTSNST